MTLVRLEPVAPRSRVKHSTTEPLRSLEGEEINRTNDRNADNIILEICSTDMLLYTLFGMLKIIFVKLRT